MNNRYLIISADDFGISQSTNEAIRELFDTEKITSAGILAPAEFAQDAALMAKHRGYSAGIHWTLNSEWPGENRWKPCASDACSLQELDLLTADTGKVKQARSNDVTKELEAQYRFLLELGCRPDHADSHCGTLYGINGRFFFLNAYKLCAKYGIPFRFSKTDGFLARQFDRQPGLPLSTARRAVSGCAKLYGVPLLDDFYSDPRPVEKIGSPRELKAYYEGQLGTLSGRICEVFLHPSLPDDALMARSSQWRKRVWEYEYLKSGQLKKAAEKLGFTVVSWADAPFLQEEER